jgi:hypothetical protein
MADATCSHESTSKVWFFKWWLCPACMDWVRKITKETMEAK